MFIFLNKSWKKRDYTGICMAGGTIVAAVVGGKRSTAGNVGKVVTDVPGQLLF